MKLPVFRKSQMDKIESVIASLAKRGDQLAEKRIAAQKALGKAIKARQEALLSGDLDDQRALDKLQGTVDSAKSALSGIEDALGLLAQQKAEAEAGLAAERDRAERAKVSDEINAAVSDIEKRVEPTLSAMREIAENLMALDHLSFEIGQLGRHLSGVAGEAEIAFAFVVPDVRRMVGAVKDGSAAIPLRPKAPPVPVPEPVAPTMTVFMLRSANYRDHDGRKRFAGQYEDAMMPVPTAQRALRHGAAVPVTDPRRAQLRGARGSDYRPLAPDVVDLDAIEEPKGVPYVVSDPALREANFTVIDRGPARALKVTP
ncbi:hypothetical protein SAMN05443248_8380 [Bradyrhizobium erythrophlei]|uniref:Uncharacterized protein n=1 Tax=Bradyrhizobium erythrophlei TaxID=1437360 RepID=A0A1M5YJB6_9BRAD|nr:hypothetical protein SAMN05443248_8380 [Bradyrhizobium erythrophlei]